MGEAGAEAAPGAPPHGGPPRRVERRGVRATVLDQNRSGCQGGRGPHDLLPKSTGQASRAQGRDEGTGGKLVRRLRTRVRGQAGREPTPSAAGSDRHWVKTTAVGGRDRGYEGGKQSKGRHRHGLVDPIGVLLVVLSTSAA